MVCGGEVVVLDFMVWIKFVLVFGFLLIVVLFFGFQG